ncbi:MAG: substrate-binding domain-containing protein [Saccharofermentanales bacterium]
MKSEKARSIPENENSKPLHSGMKPNTLTLIINREAFLNAVFWVKIIDRLESELKRYGIRMNIHVTDDDNENLSSSENGKTDGYIIMGLVSKAVLADIETKGLPIFLLDYKYLDARHDHIRMNNRLGMKYMTQKILEKGHRNILFMGDLDFAASIRERYKGITDCIEEHPELDITLDLLYVINGLKSIEERDNLLKAVKQAPYPTVLVGANDMIAIEAISVLRKAKISIPEYISIVGFDNISESNFAQPKLTTLDVSKIDLAVLTVDIILQKFQNPGKPNLLIMIEPKIIERDSLVERRKD